MIAGFWEFFGHMTTLSMFSSVLAVSVVRYLSIYHSSLLDLVDESKAIKLTRIGSGSLTLLAYLFDFQFAARNSMVFQLLGDPQYLR